MTTRTAAELDSLTRKVTAFRTWAEFTAACADGYVPTIQISRLDSADEQLAKGALAISLIAAGCPVFNGITVLSRDMAV